MSIVREVFIYSAISHLGNNQNGINHFKRFNTLTYIASEFTGTLTYFIETNSSFDRAMAPLCNILECKKKIKKGELWDYQRWKKNVMMRIHFQGLLFFGIPVVLELCLYFHTCACVCSLAGCHYLTPSIWPEMFRRLSGQLISSNATEASPNNNHNNNNNNHNPNVWLHVEVITFAWSWRCLHWLILRLK